MRIAPQVCMDWTLDIWDPDLAASNRVRSEVFFPVAESGLELDFVFTEKNVTVCLVDICFPNSNRSRIAWI